MTLTENSCWFIEVELDRKRENISDEVIEAILEALLSLDLHPAVGGTPHNGNLTIRITAEGEDCLNTLTSSTGLIRGLLNTLGVTDPVIGLEILTEAEFDRRLALPNGTPA